VRGDFSRQGDIRPIISITINKEASPAVPTKSPVDFESPGYSKAVFDAIPFPVLIVDGDVRVLDYNAAASGMLGKEKEFQYRRLCGEVLLCIHADETPEGCGRSNFCPDCILRKTVNEAAADGKIHRSRARVERHVGEGKEALTLLLFSHSICDKCMKEQFGDFGP
jgi:PAS domain-containing protein